MVSRPRDGAPGEVPHRFLRAEFRALRQPANPVQPLQLRTFVGWERPVADVSRLLNATRQALRVAEQLLESYAQGECLAESVTSTLAQALHTLDSVAARQGEYERPLALEQEGQFMPAASAADEPGAAPPSPGMPLSKRERQVVELIARGRSNREIGTVLVITERTAEAHVTHILQKLSMRSRAQVAVWAVERALVVSSQAL